MEPKKIWAGWFAWKGLVGSVEIRMFPSEVLPHVNLLILIAMLVRSGLCRAKYIFRSLHKLANPKSGFRVSAICRAAMSTHSTS